MLKHIFRYELLQLFREKESLWWNLLFPVVLATLFQIAFSNLASEEQFQTIPVAVVSEDTKDQSEETSAFYAMLKALGESEGNPVLKITYTSGEDALSLLEQKKITGILYEGSPVTLSVSSEMSSQRLQQSILDSLVQQYNTQHAVLSEIAEKHAEGLPAALNALKEENVYLSECSLSDSGKDPTAVYFFNLLSMACLFAAAGGIQVTVRNQANLSCLGARKSISPVPRHFSLLYALFAVGLFQFFCAAIGLLYITMVLKVEFGSQFGFVLLTVLFGCITGVCFGFCIGCMNRFDERVKSGIQMAVTMICCFCSGLMIGNIRMIIQDICPWFNYINPAALISDSFYALTVYQSHQRYWQNSLTLLALSVLFCLCGLFMIRRNKHAAL